MKIKLNNILKRTDEKMRIQENEEGTTTKNIEEIKTEESVDNCDVKKVRRRNTKRAKELPKFKDAMKNLLLNKNNFSKGTYTLLFLMFSLAVISVSITYKSYKLANEEKYISFIDEEEVQAVSNNIEKEENVEQDNLTNNQDTNISQENETDTVSTNNSTIQTTSTDNTKKEQVIIKETLDFKSPLSGEVQKIYSVDKVIYSKTLEMWKTHDGIDISGKMGEAVYASEKGTVEKIFNDSFLGMTVVISHISGYKTSYSNLSEDVPVKVGQKVKKGQRIGNISDTSIGEIKDDPHVHFMVFKNNETINPSTILD